MVLTQGGWSVNLIALINVLLRRFWIMKWTKKHALNKYINITILFIYLLQCIQILTRGGPNFDFTWLWTSSISKNENAPNIRVVHTSWNSWYMFQECYEDSHTWFIYFLNLKIQFKSIKLVWGSAYIRDSALHFLSFFQFIRVNHINAWLDKRMDKILSKLLAEIATFSNALSTPSLCHVTDQCDHLGRQDEEVWVMLRGWLQSCPVEERSYLSR